MSGSGQLFTPRKVQQEIRRRGYRCAVFHNGHSFEVIRSHLASGAEMKACQKKLADNPRGHVGTYDPTILLDWLAEDMAAFLREAA